MRLALRTGANIGFWIGVLCSAALFLLYLKLLVWDPHDAIWSGANGEMGKAIGWYIIYSVLALILTGLTAAPILAVSALLGITVAWFTAGSKSKSDSKSPDDSL